MPNYFGVKVLEGKRGKVNTRKICSSKQQKFIT